jgi:hypothetical protein
MIYIIPPGNGMLVLNCGNMGLLVKRRKQASKAADPKAHASPGTGCSLVSDVALIPAGAHRRLTCISQFKQKRPPLDTAGAEKSGYLTPVMD